MWGPTPRGPQDTERGDRAASSTLWQQRTRSRNTWVVGRYLAKKRRKGGQVEASIALKVSGRRKCKTKRGRTRSHWRAASAASTSETGDPGRPI